jgi:hypothetical protein
VVYTKLYCFGTFHVTFDQFSLAGQVFCNSFEPII